MRLDPHTSFSDICRCETLHSIYLQLGQGFKEGLGLDLAARVGDEEGGQDLLTEVGHSLQSMHGGGHT